ncbi:unnamed protein product [Euphydryas editha]|uniref:Cytochrome P450 n=1 Tax=Euphydryas editha TaxID=104508 RepID=A0AAU9UBR5_EUPED|nr:unnamed protein product [Euphydryas editha]
MIFFLILILVILYWTWVTRRRNGEPPKISGSLPLIGHTYKMFGNTVQLWDKFVELSNECLSKGNASYFLIFAKKLYVLTDPDDIDLVSNICLQKDKVFSELTKRLVGEGLLFAEVPTWKRHRKLIMPAFNQQVLDSYLPIFNTEARNLDTDTNVQM